MKTFGVERGQTNFKNLSSDLWKSTDDPKISFYDGGG